MPQAVANISFTHNYIIFQFIKKLKNMKTNILSTTQFLGVLIAVLFLNGCKKSNTDNPSAFPAQPEAMPAFNTQSGGVYKGTLI